jgi:CheY-like chemotaxis protein
MTDEKSALILIVDDDYDFLELNRLVLERAGYRVATAAEPRQALLLMEKEKPDLVITDLMMTTLDSGFLFARAIKEDARYAHIPVIIATSVSSALGLDFRPRTDEDRANMYVDAYFDKPLDRARLLATIAELLAASGRAAREAAAREGDSGRAGDRDAAPQAAPREAPAGDASPET